MAAVRKPFHATTNHTILLGPVPSNLKGTESQDYYCWLRNASEGGFPNGLTSQGTLARKDQAQLVSSGEFGGRENLDYQYMRPRIREDLLPHDFSRWRNTPDGSVSPRTTNSSPERDHGNFQQSSAMHSSVTKSPERMRSPSASVGSSPFRSRFADVLKKFHPSNGPPPEQSGNNRASGYITAASDRLQVQALSAEPFSGGASSVGETVDSVVEDTDSLEPDEEREEQEETPTMAAVRGRGSGVVDQTLYQNLVEMIPLMETFMDQQGGRSSFLHRASLVYTPAPSRDPQPRKQAVESPTKIKRPYPLRRASLISKHVDPKDGSPRWEESENILRRVEGDGLEETQTSYGNSYQFPGDFGDRSEVFFLQSQIDDLRRQLLEKDNLLQFAQQAQHQAQQAMQDAATQADLNRLQSTIDGLQQELWEKDRVAQSAQSHLANKQDQVAEMQRLLARLEAKHHSQNDQAAKREEELNALRCQVAALRFQLEAVYQHESLESLGLADHATSEERSDTQSLAVSSSDASSSEQDLGQTRDQYGSASTSGATSATAHSDRPAVLRQEYEKMEVARKQYLAAIIAARETPSDEAFALVAELRMQLQAFLTQPSFSFEAGTQDATLGVLWPAAA